jgi:predicted RNA binding protein YcfA (HicA-like mRNA interferase family)
VSKQAKLLAKIRNNPRAVRFEELTKLLEWYGFELKRINGSHHAYTDGCHVIIVVRRKPHVCTAAVKEALGIIDKIIEDEGEPPEDE